MNEIVLLGGGGHSWDILESIEATQGIEATGFLDDFDPASMPIEGRDLMCLGTIDDLHRLPTNVEYIIAMGYPEKRHAIWKRVRDAPRQAYTHVDPSAETARNVTLGNGVVILAGSHISPNAQLRDQVHVSYMAAVGHDSIVGECSTVMPAAIVSGDVHIGADVLIGTNATVLEGRRIGDHARIGAGAVVNKNVEPGATVVGIPARPILSST